MGFAPATAPSPERSSLILVSLDTFRGDAFGAGGNPTARTPWLDRLARSGVQFEAGAAPTPLTLPSHASLLTGRDPTGHGVHDNGTFRLPSGVPTLAEALRREGIATAAFVAAFPLDSRFGLDRGFDVYDDRTGDRGHLGTFAMDQRPWPEVTAAAAEWIEARRPGERSFVLVHLFDAHTPWTADPIVRAAVGGDAYLADVREADAGLGAVVKSARRAGNFWIVVVGDHGESLGEHDEGNHGVFVYDATIRVPAVVWPAPRHERVGLRRGTFRLVDFPATALPLLGLDPSEFGTSAFDAPRDRPAYVESLYAFFHYGWAPLRGVRWGEWKYVAAPEPELYHLGTDPSERRDVALEHPEQLHRLAEALAEMTSNVVRADAIAPDEETRRALAALGYVTDRAPPEGAQREALPDPKAMMHGQDRLERAQAHLAAGNPEAALAVLRQALGRNPSNKEVHHLMGLAHAMAGRPGRAADSFRRCLDTPPHRRDRVPRFELSRVYLQAGKPEKAVRELLVLLDEHPESAESWYALGLAQDMQARPEEARAAWEKALDADPGYTPAREALGR